MKILGDNYGAKKKKKKVKEKKEEKKEKTKKYSKSVKVYQQNSNQDCKAKISKFFFKMFFERKFCFRCTTNNLVPTIRTVKGLYHCLYLVQFVN